MVKRQEFQAALEEAAGEAPRTDSGIPLIGYDDLDLQNAQAAALISVLADMIEASCVLAPAVPAKAA